MIGGKMNNPISILFHSHEHFLEQLKEYVKTDIPEGTNYFNISATLLLKLIEGKAVVQHKNE